MSSIRFACLLLGAIALEPIMARAQTETPTETGSDTGAPTPTPGTGVETPVKLGFTALYDTNVAGGSKALAAARGLVEQDEKYSPLATINYTRTFGQESIYLNGIAGYDFYQRNSVLNREHIDLEGGLSTTLKNCVVTLKSDLSRRQSSLEDIVGSVTKNTITKAAVGIDGQCNRDVGFSPFISAQRSWSGNSAQALVNNDNRMWVVDGGVSYSQPTLGKVSAFVDYDDVLFPKRQVIVGGTLQKDRYALWMEGLRFERDLGSRLNLTVSASYASLNPSTPFEPKFDGFAYNGMLQYLLTERLKLQASFEHKPTPSNQLNASYSIDTLYRFGADYQLSGRTTIDLFFQSKRERLHGEFIVPGIDLSSETLSSVGGSVTYQLNSRFSLQVFTEDEKRHADIGIYSYNSTRAGITLSAAL